MSEISPRESALRCLKDADSAPTGASTLVGAAQVYALLDVADAIRSLSLPSYEGMVAVASFDQGGRR